MISAISPDGARANFATPEALATWLRSGPHGVIRVFTLSLTDGGEKGEEGRGQGRPIRTPLSALSLAAVGEEHMAKPATVRDFLDGAGVDLPSPGAAHSPALAPSVIA